MTPPFIKFLHVKYFIIKGKVTNRSSHVPFLFMSLTWHQRAYSKIYCPCGQRLFLRLWTQPRVPSRCYWCFTTVVLLSFLVSVCGLCAPKLCATDSLRAETLLCPHQLSPMCIKQTLASNMHSGYSGGRYRSWEWGSPWLRLGNILCAWLGSRDFPPLVPLHVTCRQHCTNEKSPTCSLDRLWGWSYFSPT